MAEPGDVAKTGIPTESAKIDAGAKPSKLASHLPLEVRIQFSKYAAKADEILIRLQRFFTTTANVETFLATLNYTLYLLIYAQKASRPSPAAAVLNGLRFVEGARNSLRLLQLPVLYTLLRTLLSQPLSSRGDAVIWHINVTQCAFNILYQLLENVAYVIELGFLSSSSIPIVLYRTQSTLWLHSNRFWLAGITCDLARLAREAILERRQTSSKGKRMIRTKDEQEKIYAHWWNELTMAGCTWPLVLNWSLENGLSMVNDGVIGTLGVLASFETLRQRWEETKTG